MAELEPNDSWQDRGIIKITDGTSVVDISTDGELKTKDTHSSTSSTSGGQKIIFVQDDETRNLLGKILKELKIMNLHNMVVTDNIFTVADVEA